MGYWGDDDYSNQNRKQAFWDRYEDEKREEIKKAAFEKLKEAGYNSWEEYNNAYDFYTERQEINRRNDFLNRK